MLRLSTKCSHERDARDATYAAHLRRANEYHSLINALRRHERVMQDKQSHRANSDLLRVDITLDGSYIQLSFSSLTQFAGTSNSFRVGITSSRYLSPSSECSLGFLSMNRIFSLPSSSRSFFTLSPCPGRTNIKLSNHSPKAPPTSFADCIIAGSSGADTSLEERRRQKHRSASS